MKESAALIQRAVIGRTKINPPTPSPSGLPPSNRLSIRTFSWPRGLNAELFCGVREKPKKILVERKFAKPIQEKKNHKPINNYELLTVNE